MISTQAKSEIYSPVSFEKHDIAYAYKRLSFAHEKGGFHMNRENDDKIKEVFQSIMKKIGKKILEGKISDIMKISKPIQMCYPLSFLEAIANDYVYCSKYFKLAAVENDPLKRLKYVITGIVAGYHLNSTILKNKAPFDPIVGETYQAKKSDGTQIYLEQIIDDPPKSSYLLVGPDNLYKYHGCGEITAQMGMNILYGDRVGKNTLKFKDHTEIHITNPSMEVSGLLMGDRILNFVKTAYFDDKTNHIIAELNFPRQTQIGKLGSVVTKFFKKSESKPKLSDFFNIIIYKYSKSTEGKKVPICEGSGSWLEYLQFDGNIFWKISEEIEQWDSTMSNILQSSCLLRKDIIYLKAKNLEYAEREKTNLEEKMVSDRKNRKEILKNSKNL